MPRLPKLASLIPYAAIFCFFAFVIYPQMFTPGQILRMSDFIFPNLNNQTNFDLFFYSWTNYGFGQPSIPSLSMALVYYLSSTLGVAMAQQLFGLAPLVVASIGMYLFLTETKWIGSRFCAF